MEKLHIYAQVMWHTEAYIIGDREALTALRDAIDAALTDNHAQLESSTRDGEGYEVIVQVLPTADHLWSTLALPYTDEIARRTNERTVYPSDITK